MPLSPVIAQLTDRLSRGGTGPLLTQYRPASRSSSPADLDRIELSVATFANWVAKTTNWINEFDLEKPIVRLDILREMPQHWLSAVAVYGVLGAGGTISFNPDESADLILVTPAQADHLPTLAAPTAVITSDLLARPQTARSDAPAGLLDFSSEVLPQPDLADPQPVAAHWWIDASQRLATSELVSIAGTSATRLSAAAPAREFIQTQLFPAIAGSGRLVLAPEVTDHDSVAHIRHVEQVSATELPD